MSDPSTAAPATLFAEYEPRGASHEREALPGLIVRSSTLADCGELARIAWQRNGGELARYIERFQRDLRSCLSAHDSLWLSAEVNQRIAGFGKVFQFAPADDAPSNSAPAGFYLGGVTVMPEFRRRGIGFELTRKRLAWIANRAKEAFYFANIQNRASIDLHARLGFIELTRNFHIPGASFVGGIGALFRSELAHPIIAVITA